MSSCHVGSLSVGWKNDSIWGSLVLLKRVSNPGCCTGSGSLWRVGGQPSRCSISSRASQELDFHQPQWGCYQGEHLISVYGILVISILWCSIHSFVWYSLYAWYPWYPWYPWYGFDLGSQEPFGWRVRSLAQCGNLSPMDAMELHKWKLLDVIEGDCEHGQIVKNDEQLRFEKLNP